MRFEFATAGRIILGRGVISQIGNEASRLGRRALIVGGSSSARLGNVLENFKASGVETAWFGVSGEPGLRDVEAGVLAARDAGCDMVVAVGGGSSIDAGKAIAAMLGNPGELKDYLEVIGRGKSLPNKSVPFIAAPTTSGTGSEVTRNAVLASPEHKVKVSLRSPGMLPVLAIVDPDLTRGLSAELTASTGMDALTQLIEPLVSSKANPVTDALCREGIRRCARSLPVAYRDGADMAAREDMSVAALFGGLALANAGLGAVHGFAGPLGGMFPAPHGAVCAALLPHVMSANIGALRSRSPGSETLTRFDQIGELLVGRPGAKGYDAVEWVKNLSSELRIPPLSAYGITSSDVPAIVEHAKRASSMKANPLPLQDDELASILHAAL